MNRTIIAMLSLALAGGCVSPTPLYNEPVTGRTATLVFRNSTIGESSVSLYQDAARCTNRSDSGAIQPQSEKRLKVMANQDIAFTFHLILRTYPTKICHPTLTFLPVENETYEASLSIDRDEKRCLIDLKKIDTHSGGRIPVLPQQRVFRAASSDTSHWCKPLPRSKDQKGQGR